jgi:hypothetical protein
MYRRTLLVISLTLLTVRCLAANSLGDPRFYASLRRLDLATRLDQVCDYEAMLRIGRDPRRFHPDRAKAEVISTPNRTENAITANGGAFRSDGRWYALSYSCKTTPNHLAVTDFSYRIGAVIPESDWSKYGLWR